MSTIEAATLVPNPVEALLTAISFFQNQSAFARKLSEVSGKPVTSAHVANWLRRGPDGERVAGGGQGVSARFAPHVEQISGVPVEALCPNVPWALIRGTVRPPMPTSKAGKDGPKAVSTD